MPSDEQPCLETSLMETLSRVPQLLIECGRQHALRELRSICQYARVAATAQITRVTVNVLEPALSKDLVILPRFLQSCTLRCLSMILHSIRSGAHHAQFDSQLGCYVATAVKDM